MVAHNADNSSNIFLTGIHAGVFTPASTQWRSTMSHSKNIQIKYELFQAIARFVENHPDCDDPDYNFIAQGIQEKYEALARRSLYTLYKSSADADTRALAREMYLDHQNVHDGFRWSRSDDMNVNHHLISD